MINGLPERLRKLREQYGLSQRTVAKQLGISPSVVSGYETGERTPSVEVLLAMAYLYRCSTDYLLGKDLEKPVQTVDVSHLSNNQIRILNELVEAMTE